MNYSLCQYVLFFCLYSLCGWLWESAFVSLRRRQWVNRGFLRGPIVPVYGFGALIILLSTLTVRENIWLVYVVGMAAASLLEYFTGALMEALFHTRYWDYSDKLFNLNGHICLGCSLGWGLFSVILVFVIHPPLARAVLSLPPRILQAFALLLSIAVLSDTLISCRKAISTTEAPPKTV